MLIAALSALYAFLLTALFSSTVTVTPLAFGMTIGNIILFIAMIIPGGLLAVGTIWAVIGLLALFGLAVGGTVAGVASLISAKPRR